RSPFEAPSPKAALTCSGVSAWHGSPDNTDRGRGLSTAGAPLCGRSEAAWLLAAAEDGTELAASCGSAWPSSVEQAVASTASDPTANTVSTRFISCTALRRRRPRRSSHPYPLARRSPCRRSMRSEEHTSELQSRENLVCRLLLEKKKK